MSSFVRQPFVLLCLLLLVAPWISASAMAQTGDLGRCDLAVEPAATLLLPYFEVDIFNTDGVTTLFSINNAWSEPTLAHLTFWTDYGMPTLDFPLFLTGYDLVTINLRDIFLNGNLPITADEQSDALDTISPHGFFPEWDGSFPQCDNFFPFFVNPVIQANLLERIQAYHLGFAETESGQCAGRNHGDNLVRGYITIDDARECSLGGPSSTTPPGPSDTPYFVDGGQGVATNHNQLWGDFYLVNPAEDSAIGEPLVHVQAFGNPVDTPWKEGDTTFYGHHHDGSTANNREPLPSIFGVRYLTGSGFSGGTELIAWRETPATEPVDCNGIDLPAPLPLDQREAYAFNEEEEVEDLCFQPGCPVCSPPFIPIFYNCLPLATQRTDIADDDFFTPPGFDAGWLYLDLNQRFPEEAPRQGWVASRVSASGRFSVGLPAVSLHSTCDELPEIIDLLAF